MRTYKVGDEVSVVEERRGSTLESGKIYKITDVHDFGRVLAGVSHNQSVKVEGSDHWFSGWWFDPEAAAVYYYDDRTDEKD